jgi:hydroxymethylbilane synthase
VQNGKLRMRGFVASTDGGRMVRAEMTGEIADPEALGKRVADALLAQGAGEILAALAL